MKNKGTIKKILIGLGVAIVLLGVYAAITNTNQTTGVSTSSLSSLVGQGNLGQVQETDTALANAEILRILGGIENIDLDDDIFTNPVFRELEDSRFTIPKPTRIGRPNPFLPIGFNGFSGINNNTSQNNGFTPEAENFFNVIQDGTAAQPDPNSQGNEVSNDFFTQPAV